MPEGQQQEQDVAVKRMMAFEVGIAHLCKDAGFDYDINSSMLVESGGLVFYGTKNGLLLGIDAGSGELRWKHRAGVGWVNTLCPLDSHRVVLTDADGIVTLLRHTG